MSGGGRTGATGGPLHPIGVVERRTGIPGHVLRAWERRYGVVTPQRTDGGHRLYSERDVELLDVLSRLVERGYRIGRLTGLSEAERLELLARAPRPDRPDEGRAGEREAGPELDRCKRAVQELDGAALGSILERAASTASPMRFMTGLVSPLLSWVGDSWAEGTLTPAHEHLCSEVVGRLLAARVDAVSGAAPGPRLVAATLAGERHYLGGLLAALTAAAAGWKTTWVGPDLPAHDLATATRQLDAKAVAVSIVGPGAEGAPDLDHQVAELRALLPGAVALYVGGPGLPEDEPVPVDGVRTPGSLEALHDALEAALPDNAGGSR